MEKLLGNLSVCVLLLTFIFIVSCKKTATKQQANTVQQQEYSCLKNTASDSIGVQHFMANMSKAFKNNDSLFISNHIKFPYSSSNTPINSKAYFYKNDFEIVEKYLNSIDIPKDEIDYVSREEYFELEEDASNCYTYTIYNSFGDLEFTVVLTLIKDENQFKIKKIMLAG